MANQPRNLSPPGQDDGFGAITITFDVPISVTGMPGASSGRKRHKKGTRTKSSKSHGSKRGRLHEAKSSLVSSRKASEHYDANPSGDTRIGTADSEEDLLVDASADGNSKSFELAASRVFGGSLKNDGATTPLTRRHAASLLTQGDEIEFSRMHLPAGNSFKTPDSDVRSSHSQSGRESGSLVVRELDEDNGTGSASRSRRASSSSALHGFAKTDTPV